MVMRIFSISDLAVTELDSLAVEFERAASRSAEPGTGYLWISLSRDAFRTELASVQTALQRLAGTALVDLHVSDLLNEQLPSHYDFTSLYDLLVFRRLASLPGAQQAAAAASPSRDNVLAKASPPPPPPPSRRQPPPTLRRIDTRPVGFVVFDRVLLSVHADDLLLRDAFAARLVTATAQAGEPAAAAAENRTSAARLPASPADLMLRMVNQVVDGYLDLRRDLTQRIDAWQRELIDPRSRLQDWSALMETRESLRQLDDVCDDQRSAVQDWIDELETLPPADGPRATRERDLLLVRGRDVLEHIERVVRHVERLEANAEAAVQMHFNVQSNRTNDIMRVLTVLTAVFLPLNLIAGIFGMNFESIPLLHKTDGFWIAMGAMALIALVSIVVFRRKRYLERGGR